ncbi:MAG: hypothetical protein RR238_09895 [Lachnospiraceae bacterium]
MKDTNKIKHIIFISVILLISLFTAIGNRKNDYYEWNFPENAISNADNQGGARFDLDQGDYSITIQYDTTSDTAGCEVYRPTAVTANNEKGVVLVTQRLPKEQQEITFPLSVAGLHTDVLLRPLCEAGELTLHNILIKSAAPHYTDSYFLLICFWGILFILYYCYKQKRMVDATPLLTIACVTLITTIPFCTDYLVWGDDLAFHMARVEGIYRALQTGQFPVRLNMMQSNGYGYATPIMYPELFLYIPAFLRFTGISLMLAFKIFLALINAATAFLSYRCFTTIAHSKYAGLVGSVIYTLCSYRLIDLYVREATGEVLAMVFIPLVLYGMYEIFFGNYKRWILAVLGYTCVLQSHVLSLFMTVVFSVLFGAVFVFRLIRDRRRLWALLKAAITTVLLNLWFLIPFLEYNQLDFPAIHGDVLYDLHEQSIYLPQMIAMFLKPYELSGSSGLGQMQGEMPLSMGMMLAVGVIIFLYSAVYLKGQEQDSLLKREKTIGWIALAFGGLALFMTSWIFPWEMIQTWEPISQLFSKVQFPWRWLVMVSMAFSVVSMVGIHTVFLSKWEKHREYTVVEHVLFSVLIMAMLSGLYLIEGTGQMSCTHNKAEFTGINFTDGMYYYADTDTGQWREQGDEIIVSPDAEVEISHYRKTGNQIQAQIQAPVRTEASYLELPLAYYPHYAATMDERAVPVIRGNNNVVRVPLTADRGSLQVWFQEPLSWRIANVISLTTLLCMIGISSKIFFSKRKSK